MPLLLRSVRPENTEAQRYPDSRKKNQGKFRFLKSYGVNGKKDTAGIVGQAEPHFSLLFSERTLTRRLLDEAGSSADEGLGVLFPILDELADITENMSIAGGAVDKVLEALQHKGRECSRRI